MKKNNLDKFLGSIYGLAISDAFSFPYEDLLTSDFAKKISIDTSIYPGSKNHPSGQYTFNTEVVFAVVDSIIKKNDIDSKSILNELIDLYIDKKPFGNGYKTKEMIDKIISGLEYDRARASIGSTDFTPLLRSVPIGLWLSNGKIKNLIKSAIEVSEITHSDYRVSACSVAVSAGVAGLVDKTNQVDSKKFLAFIAEAVSRVDDKIADYFISINTLLKKDIPGAELKLKKLGNDNFSPYEYGGGLSPFCLSTVFIAFYHFLLNQTNFSNMLHSIIKAGGIISGAASIAGSLWGALNGYDKLPAPLVNFLINKEMIYEKCVNFYKVK